jgi:hypothetical protein
VNADQRKRQLARVHVAKKDLGWDDGQYRDFLEAHTGLRSCGDMSDRQLNQVLDWMMHHLGRRPQPKSLSRDGSDAHANLARMAYALAREVPPGYARSPLRSMVWQKRTCGRCAVYFEELSTAELVKLIEAAKAIAARAEHVGV